MKISNAVEPQSQENHTAPDSQNLDISKRLEIAERRLKIASDLMRYSGNIIWYDWQYNKWKAAGILFATFEEALDAAAEAYDFE